MKVVLYYLLAIATAYGYVVLLDFIAAKSTILFLIGLCGLPALIALDCWLVYVLFYKPLIKKYEQVNNSNLSNSTSSPTNS